MTIRRGLFFLALTIFFSSTGVCCAENRDFWHAQKSGLHLTRLAYDTRPDEAIYLAGTAGGKEEENTAGKSSSSMETFSKKYHKYLGYTTVLLAAVTAVSSGSEDLHWAAAYSTAGFAALTVTTGSVAYGHRFNPGEGWFTEDNTHIILGTLGAVGCIAAVIMADSDGGNGHAGAGIFGGTAMAASILTIRW